MKREVIHNIKSPLKAVMTQSITTVDPKSIIQESTLSELRDGCLLTFTFDHQKEVFSYIKIIGCYVDKNIPAFRDVWPYLGAYTESGHWHPKLDSNLEFIGTAHYTVLKSLCYIFLNKDLVVPNDPEQRYKNVIFHYAVINDCIRELCAHLLRFEKKLDPNLSKYIRESQYIESLKKSVGLPNRELKFASFNQFKIKQIDPLRNAFLHNPSIDIFWRGQKIFVVKPEYVGSHKIIGKISMLKSENLVNPNILMNNLFTQLTRILPEVWSAFYDEIKRINTHPCFGKKWINRN